MDADTIAQKAYLLIGGNLGDRLHNLAGARMLIEKECGNISKRSSIYETAAWGMQDQPAFLNQAIELITVMPASDLMSCLLGIEQSLGRIRHEKFGPRLIDIDILLYNNEIHHSPFLKIPHPRLPERRFALKPLAEIAPFLVHPVLHKSISDLLKDCDDPLEVKIYE